MKAKLLILSAIVALSLTTPAFAKTRVVQTRNGQALVTNTSNHRNHWRGDRFRSGSSVFWNVGIGVPFYGGYYGGTPYYGGYSYYGGYPTTAAPIMAVIRTVRTAIATLTDTGPTIMARVIRPTITGASIAVPADQLLRACKNGSPVLDIIAAQSMA
jgi:hypothetical protein